jgi:hypothetical protein
MNRYRAILSNIPPAPILCYDVTNVNSYPGSGTLVTDIFKNSNATLINGPVYSAFTSGSLFFDGVNEYLMTSTDLSSKFPGSSPNKSEVTSIFMWVYPMDNGVILTEQGLTSLNIGWHDSQIEMVSGTMRFGMWNGGGVSSASSSIATPFNRWYYVGLVYDGSILTGYVNGDIAGTVTFNRAAPYNNGSNLHYAIAAADSTSMGDGSYAKMYLGRFEVYNCLLSQSQINYNYNLTKQPYINSEGFNYLNFASTSGLALVGNASVSSNKISLTTATNVQLGNVYRTNPIRYDRDFSIEWSFYCGGGTGADGYTLQWTTTNNTTGAGGGGCSYVSNAKNAFIFQTFSNNRLVWYANNVIQSTTNVSSGLWRQTLYYWGDYDHNAQTMKIYYNTTNIKPSSANFTFSSFSFDSTQYYLGFGAATGGANDNHELLSLKLIFL